MIIFLTGASGLLGHALADAFVKKKWIVHASVHNRRPPASSVIGHDMDLSQSGNLDELFDAIRPDAIVNAAALAAPAECQDNPPLSKAVNVDLPHELARLALTHQSRLIHFSSDMVFDGKSGHYSESDATNPTNLYGKHKQQSENHVLSVLPSSCVLRLPLLTGNSPAGTRSVHEVHWKVWKTQSITPLFEDEWRQPTSVSNVAALTMELLEKPEIQGLFHWAGATRLNRWEIGRLIAKQLNVPENLLQRSRARNHPEFKDRPLDLTMDCSKLKGQVQTEPALFDEQLNEINIPGH